MGDNRTDRQTFDRSVREQYNRETAQVHAPAELIHRTKDAVRREEQRIAQEQAGQKMSEQQNGGGSRAKAGRAYGRLHRWALGTAAAAVLLLVGASGLFFGRVGRSSEKSASDTAVQEIAEDTTAADTAVVEETEAETAEEGGLGKQLGTAANTADYAVEEIAPASAEEEKRKYEPRPQTAAAESAAAAISGAADETTDGMAAGDWAEADLDAVKEPAADSSADAVPTLTGVQFYDKDKNAVEAEALWYNAARIESILIQWEGGTPADIKVFRTPVGSETAEQTELLMTKSIPDGDKSVLLDADMLHDVGMGSHLFFELDFGTQIVKSEEYNIFYDESVLPDAGD